MGKTNANGAAVGAERTETAGAENGRPAGSRPRRPRWQRFTDGNWVTIPDPDGSCRLLASRVGGVPGGGDQAVTTIATFHRETGDPDATAEGNATLAAYAPQMLEAIGSLCDAGLVDPNPPKDTGSLAFAVWQERKTLLDHARRVRQAATSAWNARPDMIGGGR